MSSSQSSDRGQLLRFLGSGVVNTVAGFATIFLLMALGANPSVANVAGYAVGLALSFLLSRRFVFGGDDAVHREAVRFLVAFALAFGANFVALQVLLGPLHVAPVAAQIGAAIVYTVLMYGLSKWFVFRSAASTRSPR